MTARRCSLRKSESARDSTTFARLRDIALTAQELIAGPDADFTARVRAAQVYAALSDPVVVFADQPATQLRAAILDGAQRLLGSKVPRNTTPRTEGSTGVSARSRTRRGRPGAMTEAMVESARRMRDSGDYTIDEIAAELGVSRATVYRKLTPSGDPATL